WRVRKFGGWKSFILGGEGLVFEVWGPARVYIQSRIIPPFANILRKFIPSK
ncbi:MAG: TIGR00266 family protein, partial [Thermoprotei archaeon]